MVAARKIADRFPGTLLLDLRFADEEVLARSDQFWMTGWPRSSGWPEYPWRSIPRTAGRSFVPSVEGISHNEHKYTRDEDIVAGLHMLTAVVQRLAEGELDRG